MIHHVFEMLVSIEQTADRLRNGIGDSRDLDRIVDMAQRLAAKAVARNLPRQASETSRADGVASAIRLITAWVDDNTSPGTGENLLPGQLASELDERRDAESVAALVSAAVELAGRFLISACGGREQAFAVLNRIAMDEARGLAP